MKGNANGKAEYGLEMPIPGFGVLQISDAQEGFKAHQRKKQKNDHLITKKEEYMKALILGLFLMLSGVQWSSAQSKQDSTSTRNYTKAEQEIINLSNTKWI